MPLAHSSKVYAVSDCKISKMTADAAGGSATYATAVDVPGIKSLEIGGDINSSELRGDNARLDQVSTLGGVTVSVSHAKVSLDVLAVLLGSTAADSGTTPNMKSTLTLAQADTPQYFKIEGATPSNGSDFVGGDVHFVLYKCIITSFPELGLAEEDYRIVSFDAVAVPQLATGNKIMDVVFNETAASIS